MNPIIPLCAFYLFCAIIAIQVFYYLFFFSRVAFHKEPSEGAGETLPVSVIICARDESRNLSERLPSVLEQDYPLEHEVLVINDNSFDDTKFVLERFTSDYPRLKPVELHQEAQLIIGKKFPLSVGIKTARYDTLVLTDADCTPASREWVRSFQNAYHPGTEVVLGYGPYEKKPGLLNRIIRFETFHTALQYFSYAQAGLPYMGVGRNLSYKKDLFFRNKGFAGHNQIPSGDDDLFINAVANARNTRIVLDASSFVYSPPKATWAEWLRQKQRHFTTSRYYKPVHKFLLGLYSGTHFLVYPLLLLSLLVTPAPWSWYIWPVFGLRFLLQAVIFYQAMRTLREKDLFWWFPLLDLWQFIYYVIFAPAVWKRPSNKWK
ncbi:glycosyltransferase [Dinghuibacter silviterrae]|uniref:Cellulose synthase/poly-beta-1,6-N-acetylglucosamine synthase-like glycosyltransferase n=1 Tax=Dinghuibacter silviterrae TaxID=1539049 RepID=A0A4R8DSR6_9BACT|nr:glycosyltransferase [Dinghuibacter silviterrae]TDX00437.1 cellulose synthase/poly-beta-1,6-N-acetylglucosamine synthase-like glycosyltransferase [Dinghuibacter silviterrae]